MRNLLKWLAATFGGLFSHSKECPSCVERKNREILKQKLDAERNEKRKIMFSYYEGSACPDCTEKLNKARNQYNIEKAQFESDYRHKEIEAQIQDEVKRGANYTEDQRALRYDVLASNPHYRVRFSFAGPGGVLPKDFFTPYPMWLSKKNIGMPCANCRELADKRIKDPEALYASLAQGSYKGELEEINGDGPYKYPIETAKAILTRTGWRKDSEVEDGFNVS